VIQRLGAVDDAEMFRTFNMGLGLVMCVPESAADDIQRALSAAGEQVQRVGRVVAHTSGARVLLA
jgi:phosphoribosylformylglycinamidine cyclo-ligase